MIWKHANNNKERLGERAKAMSSRAQARSCMISMVQLVATEGFRAAHTLLPADDGEIAAGSKRCSHSTRPPTVSTKGWAGNYCLAIRVGPFWQMKKTNPVVHFDFLGLGCYISELEWGLNFTLTDQTVAFQETFYKNVLEVPHRNILSMLTEQPLSLSPVTHLNTMENWRNYAHERRTSPLICFITLLQPWMLGCF